MRLRRFAAILLVLPAGFYAYACSSSNGGGGGEDAGPDGTVGPGGDDTVGPGTDGSTGDDDGSTTDGGKDGGDGGSPVCVGNPLTADGGPVDGGVNLDASVAKLFFDESATVATNPWVDGPQYVDFNGGSLVFSEIANDPFPTIVRIAADAGVVASSRVQLRSTGSTDLITIGNAFEDAGIVTVVTGQNGGTATAYVTKPNGDAGTSIGVGGSTNPNDLVIGPKGDLYITDAQFQTGTDATRAIYRVAPGGAVTKVTPTGTDGDSYNGIALSPDGSKLYVTVTLTSKVYSFAVSGTDQSVNAAATLVATTTDQPDGMAVDTGGNLWIAEADGASASSGRVEVFSPTGARLGQIPFPSDRPTGVAFGGSDNKNLYVTTEGQTAGTNRAGVWIFSNRCAGIR